MRLFRLIKKLIFGAPPPSKFLTPDGKPKEAALEAKPEIQLPEKPKRSGKPVILYVVTKSNFGGAQRYVYDLATHVPSEYEAVVMCGPANNSIQEGLLVRKLEEKGVQTVLLPALKRDVGFADVRAFWALYQAILAEAPAVLHLNSSKAGGLGALAGRLARVPKIIFTAHGWAFNESRNIFSQSLIWCASIATIFFAHKVICVSAYDRNTFAGWFFSNKLVAIHNGIESVDYMEQDEARRNLVPHSDLFDHQVWVGSVAELTANKNIALGLRAVKMARERGANIFYAVVGDGDERIALEDQARDMGIWEDVKFLGFMTDVQKYLKAFDVTFLPSRKEGFPYMVLESLDAQVPIVASNVGGISEVIRDGENGILCQAGNVEEFADALVKLATNEAARKNLIEEKPVNRFETMLRETYAMYR